MTRRIAHAGPAIHTVPAPAPAVPRHWLDRLGVNPAANDASGPCLRVIVERGVPAAPATSRGCVARTTTIVAGSRLEVVG